jgi:hypothetical protein
MVFKGPFTDLLCDTSLTLPSLLSNRRNTTTSSTYAVILTITVIFSSVRPQLSRVLRDIDKYSQETDREIVGAVEHDPEYKLIVEANNLTVEINSEIGAQSGVSPSVYADSGCGWNSPLTSPIPYHQALCTNTSGTTMQSASPSWSSSCRSRSTMHGPSGYDDPPKLVQHMAEPQIFRPMLIPFPRLLPLAFEK